MEAGLVNKFSYIRQVVCFFCKNVSWLEFDILDNCSSNAQTKPLTMMLLAYSFYFYFFIEIFRSDC